MSEILYNVGQREFVVQLILLNFLPLTAALFFFLFVTLNNPYEANVTRLFRIELVSIFLLILVDNVDLYNQTYNMGSLAQTISTVAGYNLRIWILLSIIEIMLRHERLTLERQILLDLPAIITFCVSMTAFNTHLMFWYEDGAIRRGPLSYTPHVACLLYGMYVLIYGIRLLWVRSRRDEAVTVIISIVVMFLATALETVFQIRGILIGMIAMAITFYYLYMFIDHFKRDELTGILNRASFNADVRKYGKKITAVVSMDLDELKQINDLQGHSAGDEAIRAVAAAAEACLPKGCSAYRMGGDEFAILCIGVDEGAVAAMVAGIRKRLEETPFHCSAGYCMWREGMDFRTVYNLADGRMYNEKKQSRSFRVERDEPRKGDGA